MIAGDLRPGDYIIAFVDSHSDRRSVALVVGVKRQDNTVSITILYPGTMDMHSFRWMSDYDLYSAKNEFYRES